MLLRAADVWPSLLPQLMPETLFLTTNLIDRFLEIKGVTRKNLQLVRFPNVQRKVLFGYLSCRTTSPKEQARIVWPLADADGSQD